MLKKIVGITLLALFVVAGTGFAYLYFREPESRPAPDIRVSMAPERIARGRYLYLLGDCQGCHTQHEFKDGAIRLVEGVEGGGQKLDMAEQKLLVPNITPDPETGIGKWTDGEKIRAIREGVGKDGSALIPMMPYGSFRHMSDDDVQSLVAYLNSLKPVRNEVPRMELPLMAQMMIKGVPRPVDGPVPAPDRSNRRLYGEYLVTIGSCEGCHTPVNGHSPDMTKRLAGGHEWVFDGRKIVSANLTPDPATGIGSWTSEYFLERFRRYRNGIPADAKKKFTIMPWLNLAQLPDEDLEVIYDYLRLQPAIENKIEKPAAD